MSYQTYGKYTEIPQAQPVEDEKSAASDADSVPADSTPAEVPQQPAEVPADIPQQPEQATAGYTQQSVEEMPAHVPQPDDAQPAEENNAQTPPKKKHAARKVILICLGAAAAVFWTVAAVMSVIQIVKLANEAAETQTVEYNYSDFSDFLPSSGDSEEPDSFSEYFAERYSTAAENNMPTVTADDDVTLELQDVPAASGEMLTYQEIYSKVSPAITGILTYVDGEEYGWGTAVIFRSDGYLVTNTHIVENCDSAVITLSDGTQYDAMLVGMDTASDIAVLKIDAQDLPYAEFADSDQMLVGDEVVAIGNPLMEQYAGTMTNGIISGINRDVQQDGYTMTLLQTNAALNEGNSGGALINMYGQVIGITNMKIMYNYSSMSTVEGIGFAVPSKVVQEVADQLLAQGHVTGQPALGITAAPVDTAAQQMYDLPAGVYVAEIRGGSDALNRNIQVGDIITAVNGENVTTVTEVNAIKNQFGVGDSLTLTIYRDGETFEEDITLVDASEIQD